MAERLTEALGRVVGNSSFRRDAALFLSLPRSSVDNLAALVESHGTFDVPSSEVSKFEQDCNLEDQGRQVLTASRLIRSAIRRIDNTEDRRRSLASFAALMTVDPFDPDDFSRFFSDLPELDGEEQRRAAIAVAPTVGDTHLDGNLRVKHFQPIAPTRARRAGFAKGTFTYMHRISMHRWKIFPTISSDDSARHACPAVVRR